MYDTETADSYSDGYPFNWSTSQPVTNLNDSNWDTYAEHWGGTGGVNAILYINYTKPYGSFAADWTIKDGDGTATYNLSECWDTYPDLIALHAASHTITPSKSLSSWRCYQHQPTSWYILRQKMNDDLITRRLYEENISWYDNRTMWIKSDDVSSERKAILDNRDDKFIKFIDVNTTCSIKDARVWIYGKSSFCDKESEKFLMKIGHHNYYFDPCEKFGSEFEWVPFKIDKSALYTGTNKIGFATLSTSGKTKRLHIGRDIDSGRGDIINQNHKRKKGRLMIRVEICKDTCLNSSFPK